MKRNLLPLPFLFFVALTANAQKNKVYEIASPDDAIHVKIDATKNLSWSVIAGSQTVLKPSAIAMHLQDGEILGSNISVISAKQQKMSAMFPALFYKKDSVENNYTQLTVTCKGDYGVIFRAYNDGVVYRFFTDKKDSIIIDSEDAEFNFPDDDTAFIPYSNSPHNGDKYQCSFENIYLPMPLSQFVRDSVAFAPVLMSLPGNKKALITEADLENFPGMFLTNATRGFGLRADHAPFALEQKQNERNPVQALVTRRANYIAKTAGKRSFPWRIVIITKSDKELLNNDMVYRLASPSRIDDVSWIKPGKVAWDWWNDWNVSHVGFKAGINTETYKYYIDFASANHIEYILMDEGWSDDRDIMSIVPAIDLREIVRYAVSKNVGVWLWMGSYPLYQKMEQAFTTYSKMGIKGFKIDFMDRDDQGMVDYYYRVAKTAAANHIMVDFHGAYKPTGLQRTYPNVVNTEGVHGMEQLKWGHDDQVTYDVSIPFIRMVAGPMDYTPGAMRNANKESFRPVNEMPMSQGTRCHQLAMYVTYEAPFEMLSDNPTAYMREQECTDFITSVPTTFDETVALAGKVREFSVIARRKGSTWFIGAMNNWTAKDIDINLSFLGDGQYNAVVFKDGINANRDATDYKKEMVSVTSSDILHIHLAPGGGWAARLSKE